MKKLNRYNINPHPIGKGRNAVVYVGHDPMHDRLVAIKSISSKKKANIERKVMKRCGNSPYIPEMYHFFTENEKYHIVMECIKGLTLDKYKKTKKISETEAVSIVITITKALVSMHKVGMKHNDITLRNIMLHGTNDLKIIDFGNAVQTNRTKRKDLDGVIQIFLHLLMNSPRIGHGKVKAIIKKGTALDEKHGYQTASELLTDLESL